jgi:hypothetical protein
MNYVEATYCYTIAGDFLPQGDVQRWKPCLRNMNFKPNKLIEYVRQHPYEDALGPGNEKLSYSIIVVYNARFETELVQWFMDHNVLIDNRYVPIDDTYDADEKIWFHFPFGSYNGFPIGIITLSETENNGLFIEQFFENLCSFDFNRLPHRKKQFDGYRKVIT